ncbi:MAG: ribulose-phosphate 3-epimerase [Patescibacteria group bacterium]|nr:MAG: ribulose-phosphate 3-epimerase [Patescibacteria group bacterium]
MEIIPAIMPKSFKELEEKASLLAGLVDVVQIDVMDGRFVPEKTWPYAGEDVSLKELAGGKRHFPESARLSYEIDLMVSQPEESMGSWIWAGARRIIFHIESIGDMDLFWEKISHIDPPADFLKALGVEKSDVELGLALNIETPNEALFPHIEKVDFVQCMGIARIGYQGEPFDERVLHKLRDLRKHYPELILSVDGGVNLETAPRLIEAGANRLVSGSAILESKDIKKRIKEFQSI